MILSFSDLFKTINKEETHTVEIEMTSIKSRLGDFPIRKKEPVTLTLKNIENDKISIKGEVKLTLDIPCSRCLETVPTAIECSIDKELKIDNGSAVDEDMETTDYLIGFNLDVDKLVYAEILVNWPMKVLCKNDCKGICKVCGTNLNIRECDCQRTELDPRMAAIQDVFNKFKEV
ncbi:uncharacterized protein SAMN04487761_10456 [Lachnospiraceae bacterium C7]|nr:uncharacterized protein SAMN04487761_10456 [Lachnospiraceae bacterium C7]